MIKFVSSTGFGGGPPPAALTIPHGTGGSITVSVQDDNGSAVAAGSTIVFAADSAVGTISQQTTSYTMGCSISNDPTQLQFLTDLVAATSPGAGNIFVTVTSPGSKTITQFTVPVTVQ